MEKPWRDPGLFYALEQGVAMAAIHKEMVVQVHAIADAALWLAARDYEVWMPVHMTWGRLFHVFK